MANIIREKLPRKSRELMTGRIIGIKKEVKTVKIIERPLSEEHRKELTGRVICLSKKQIEAMKKAVEKVEEEKKSRPEENTD